MNRQPSPCWAVAGPAGAGKSRLCARLAERGAEVVQADLVAHGLLDRPGLQADLVAAFGAGILARDGRVDRPALGRLVFADPGALRRLDALVHPPLAAVLAARLAAARLRGSPLVILEAAVYFLLPGPPPADFTLAVVASPAVRLERLVGKGLSPAQAAARIAAQAHLERTWPLADLILENDGDAADLARRADGLWRERIAPPTLDG